MVKSTDGYIYNNICNCFRFDPIYAYFILVLFRTLSDVHDKHTHAALPKADHRHRVLPIVFFFISLSLLERNNCNPIRSQN
jgi:hypothetical protein